MANKKTENQTETSTGKPERKGRSFSRKGEGLTSFVEGEEIRGKLVHVKEVKIKDRRTREPKEIRVYVLELKDGTMARIGSRALLDDAWDEVCSVYGGPDEMAGRDISFIRGGDVETKDGTTMGTYEILVWEE